MRSGTPKLIGLGSLVGLVFAVLALRPVPQPTPKNTRVVRGVLGSMEITKQADLAIRLRDDDHDYYVNRFRQSGLRLPELQEQVMPGDAIELTVIERNWTPLDPTFSTHPLAAISVDGAVVWDRVRR